MQSSNESSKRFSAAWTDELKKIFIDCMKEEISTGSFTDSGFKLQAWNRLVTNFRLKSDISFSKSQLQSHTPTWRENIKSSLLWRIRVVSAGMTNEVYLRENVSSSTSSKREMAISNFTTTFSAKYTTRENLTVKKHLHACDEATASFFLNLTEEEKQLFIEDILQQLILFLLQLMHYTIFNRHINKDLINYIL